MSKWCQKHWDMLRAEVETRGMSNLVSGNGEIVAMKQAAELQGEDDKGSFDPLMRVFWMIENRAMDMAGLAVFTEDFGCPICRFNEARNPDGSCPCADPDCPAKAPESVPDHETWIVGDTSATASVEEMCRERGWIT